MLFRIQNVLVNKVAAQYACWVDDQILTFKLVIENKGACL